MYRGQSSLSHSSPTEYFHQFAPKKCKKGLLSCDVNFSNRKCQKTAGWFLWSAVYAEWPDFGLLENAIQGSRWCWHVSRSLSVQFNCSVVSGSLRPHGRQHTRLPCPSPTLKAYSNSGPFSWWCHPTISCSAVPFPSCLQSFPASESFPVSQFFLSGGQSIGVSASGSVLPMNRTDLL